MYKHIGIDLETYKLVGNWEYDDIRNVHPNKIVFDIVLFQ